MFHCERLTLYALSDDKTTIVSRIKTGLNSAKDLRLPVSDQSIAGYVALSKRIVNIADVYDEAELKGHASGLHFLREVDRRTGYRTRQMLVAPLVEQAGGELVGVVQLINRRDGTAFDVLAEECIKQLCVTLAIAVSQRQKPTTVRSKYDQLMSDGILSAQDYARAMRNARDSGTPLEDILLDEFNVAPAALGSALARYYELPYQPWTPNRIRPLDLLKNLKRQYAEQNLWLPLQETANGLEVVAVDPEQVRHARIIHSIYPKTKIIYSVTTLREFQRMTSEFFDAAQESGSVNEMLSGMDGSDDGGDDLSSADLSLASENELVKLLNKIIIDAYRAGASDIHIEPRPGKEKTLIRLRKDGSLEPYIEIPASYRNAMLARIKIMCDLDISERRKPQDGKIKFRKFGPLDIELRVATIPSAGGVEDVVMRILSNGEPLPLDQLGVLPQNLERLKRTVSQPYGLFFVCGPTGSGKTTTLHSVLSHLNRPDTKIWTAEDPVEITQKGLRQVQVNRKTGLDFANVMRAFLRADPDVIMVGEMRDKETVAIGLEASLTGHLVLSTLHTNSAPESIARLLDMGMDPFNFADALLGILAQRLAKRLCAKCRTLYQPEAAEVQALVQEYCAELQGTAAFVRDRAAAEQEVLATLAKAHADAHGCFKLYRAVGCDHCSGGYKGRIGLHELMVGSDRLKRQIQEHAKVSEMLATGLEEGMLTLKMDGITKVLMGLTDMKQVRLVCIK